MADRAETEAGIEREIKLVVFSGKVADRIARLTTLAGYCLVRGDAFAMRDTYFDTQDRGLGSTGWSLRIREIGDQRLINVKGPTKQTDWGGVERWELELPWSRTALATAMESLPCLGSMNEGSDDLADPLIALASAGLSVIQTRTTVRRPRDVRTDPEAPIIAELVVDLVKYELPGMPVLHHEVEIEAGSSHPAQDLERMASALLDAYGDALQPWKFGKLATGFMAEELLAREGVEGFLRDGSLTREAYERMRSMAIPA